MRAGSDALFEQAQQSQRRFPNCGNTFCSVYGEVTARAGRMKILVISNFYPPHYIGGYELGCRDVVEALKARGYEVRVLTSTYGVGQPECDGEIYRWLEARIHWKGPRWVQRAKVFKMEVNNQNALRRLSQIYTPDVVYLRNLGLVSVSLALFAQRWAFRQCSFVSDDWLSP